jgi:hypothetical protein
MDPTTNISYFFTDCSICLCPLYCRHSLFSVRDKLIFFSDQACANPGLQVARASNFVPLRLEFDVASRFWNIRGPLI